MRTSLCKQEQVILKEQREECLWIINPEDSVKPGHEAMGWGSLLGCSGWSLPGNEARRWRGEGDGQPGPLSARQCDCLFCMWVIWEDRANVFHWEPESSVGNPVSKWEGFHIPMILSVNYTSIKTGKNTQVGKRFYGIKTTELLTSYFHVLCMTLELWGQCREHLRVWASSPARHGRMAALLLRLGGAGQELSRERRAAISSLSSVLTPKPHRRWLIISLTFMLCVIYSNLGLKLLSVSPPLQIRVLSTQPSTKSRMAFSTPAVSCQ